MEGEERVLRGEVRSGHFVACGFWACSVWGKEEEKRLGHSRETWSRIACGMGLDEWCAELRCGLNSRNQAPQFQTVEASVETPSTAPVRGAAWPGQGPGRSGDLMTGRELVS